MPDTSLAGSSEPIRQHTTLILDKIPKEVDPDDDEVNPDDEPPPLEPPNTTPNINTVQDEKVSHEEYADNSNYDTDDESDIEIKRSDLYNALIPPPVHLAPFLLDDPHNNSTTPTITPMLYSESTRKIAQVQMDLKDDFNICNVLKKQLTHHLQGDTGANCGATNNITLLWDYR